MSDDEESQDDELEPGGEPEEPAPAAPPPSPEELASAELNGEISKRISSAPEVDQLAFEFVRRHDKKTVRLLANSGDDRTFAGKRIWFTYEFEQPCYIEEVIVDVEDYSAFSDFDFAYTTFDGHRREQRLSPADGEIRKTINLFVKEVAFRPPRRSLANGRIEQVSIFGFPLSETSKFGEFANSLDARRDEVLEAFAKKEQQVLQKLTHLKALESRKNEIEAAIQAGKKTLEDNRIELRNLKAQREETVTRIASLENTVGENEQKIADQKNKIGEISDIRSNLARSIIDMKANLKALTDNINLFPSKL